MKFLLVLLLVVGFVAFVVAAPKVKTENVNPEPKDEEDTEVQSDPMEENDVEKQLGDEEGEEDDPDNAVAKSELQDPAEDSAEAKKRGYHRYRYSRRHYYG